MQPLRARMDLGAMAIKRKLFIPQGSSITEALPYPEHSLGESYPSAKMQSVYSADPADWSMGELRRPVVAKTPVKDHQLMLARKSSYYFDNYFDNYWNYWKNKNTMTIIIIMIIITIGKNRNILLIIIITIGKWSTGNCARNLNLTIRTNDICTT